jgi:hypothetical protein
VSLSLSDAIRRRFPPERIVDHAEKLLASEDERVVLGTLQMLTDRGYGKVLTTLELTTRQPEADVDWSAVSLDQRRVVLETMMLVAPVKVVDGPVDP